jgi:hypothetical protein
MCPVCMTTLAFVTASVTSTGGITALVVSRLRSKNNRNKERDMEHLKGHLPINTPPIVSPQEWDWNYLDITALGRQEEWEDSP